MNPRSPATCGASYSEPLPEASSLMGLRGWVDDEEIDVFLAASYTRRNVLDIILGIGMKTLSNYTTTSHTPLDPAWQAQEWSNA